MKERKGFCVTGFILGVVSLTFIDPFGICSILGFIFSILGMRRSVKPYKGMAIVGFVCSIFALVFRITVIILYFGFGIDFWSILF